MGNKLQTPAIKRITAGRLYLAATLLGVAGTALAILQALFWISPGHANHGVLILTACVPVLAAMVFAVAPRHTAEDDAPDFALTEPRAFINLALPVTITLLTLALVGMSGSFDDFAGFALLLAANAGRNLRDLGRALSMRRHPTRQP